MSPAHLHFLRWWRRTGMAFRVAIFLICSCLLALLVYWQRPADDSAYLGSNLLVFGLINFNLIVLCVLIFLVGRNVVKLIFDRKRRILGSRLRMRLVLAFVGLALVPTIILFVLASGLLNNAMSGWFSGQVEASVDGAVEVARLHYNSIQRTLSLNARKAAADLSSKPLLVRDQDTLKKFVAETRVEHRFYSLSLVQQDGTLAARDQNAAASIEDFSEPILSESALAKALQGEESVLFEEKQASQFLRAYQPSAYLGKPAVLVATHRISPEMSTAFRAVNDSFKEYEQLKLFKGPLKSVYLLTLSMITGLIVFSAIWIGFYIAREISVPIQRLAEGTRAVARGNYGYRVRVSGDDEIALLVKSFNTMTADLQQSRMQAERRRIFIESILSNLVVGVIGVDNQLRITSVNKAAAGLFGIEDLDAAVGQELATVIPEQHYSAIAALVGGKGADEGGKNFTISVNGVERTIVVTAGEINESDSSRLGTLLLFDDVTDLAKAQQMAAWREVARRIAHEIKNPLTPIQLCAQRLERLIEADAGEAKAAIRESTQTIVENVRSIKRLADEFSKFARMPAVEFHETDLNYIISEAISPFAESHPEIIFRYVAENELPPIYVDSEQIRRILINLIDNAIAALTEHPPSEPGSEARITIHSRHIAARQAVIFEVADNGPGISKVNRSRVFEPYFTTKAKGTGLGLAIVTSIIADHQGQIRLYENRPSGSRFVVELPVVAKGRVQRKLAQA